MAFAVVFSHQDLVLNMEVTHVVVKVDVLGDHETSHTGVLDSGCERYPSRVWVLNSVDSLGHGGFVAGLVSSIRGDELTDVDNVRL